MSYFLFPFRHSAFPVQFRQPFQLQKSGAVVRAELFQGLDPIGVDRTGLRLVSLRIQDPPADRLVQGDDRQLQVQRRVDVPGFADRSGHRESERRVLEALLQVPPSSKVPSHHLEAPQHSGSAAQGLDLPQPGCHGHDSAAPGWREPRIWRPDGRGLVGGGRDLLDECRSSDPEGHDPP